MVWLNCHFRRLPCGCVLKEGSGDSLSRELKETVWNKTSSENRERKEKKEKSEGYFKGRTVIGSILANRREREELEGSTSIYSFSSHRTMPETPPGV